MDSTFIRVEQTGHAARPSSERRNKLAGPYYLTIVTYQDDNRHHQPPHPTK
jgi:hypothetical protein